MDQCVQAVNRNQWLWPAWSLLSDCIENVTEYQSILPHLPVGLPTDLFRLYAQVQLHDELTLRTLTPLIKDLQLVFPGSLWLQGIIAQIHYDQKRTISSSTCSALLIHACRV